MSGARSRRPLPVTILGWLFILVGGIALAGGFFEYQHHEIGEFLVMMATRLAALVGGIFLLRGAAWARWLLVAWMVFHFVLSFFHSAVEVLVHGLMFALIGYLLFRGDVSDFLTDRRD